jgi:hypothetical protein
MQGITLLNSRVTLRFFVGPIVSAARGALRQNVVLGALRSSTLSGSGNTLREDLGNDLTLLLCDSHLLTRTAQLPGGAERISAVLVSMHAAPV